MAWRQAYALTVSMAFTASMGVGVTKATTVAYWRFEEGVAGQLLPHTFAKTDWSTYAVTDVSGNGNHLFAYDANEGGAAHAWINDVPATTIPATGATNNLAVRNTGSVPGLFTGTHQMSPTGINLQAWTPSTWTIEVSFYATDVGYRTIVGRDGRFVADHNPDLAPLYFQTVGSGDGEFNGHLAIKFVDTAGILHTAYSLAPIELGRWYHAAAVSDGTTLSLYLDSLDGNGYVLQQATLLVTSDPRLASAGNDKSWSVGRGYYGPSEDTDRWYGYIDEVRISDVALTPDQFLFAVPEPASVVLLAGGTLLMLRRRRM